MALCGNAFHVINLLSLVHPVPSKRQDLREPHSRVQCCKVDGIMATVESTFDTLLRSESLRSCCTTDSPVSLTRTATVILLCCRAVLASSGAN